MLHFLFHHAIVLIIFRHVPLEWLAAWTAPTQPQLSFFSFSFFSPFYPRSTQHKARWISAQLCDTLVPQHYWLFWNAYGSWWSIFLLFAFAAKYDLRRANFLPSCSHTVDTQVNSDIYIYKNQIIVSIGCLRQFVFCCLYPTSCHAVRLRKYEPSTSISHKVHSDATGNCRRHRHTQTRRCVIVLLVALNFPAIHFFKIPLKHSNMLPGTLAAWHDAKCARRFVCTPVHQCYSWIRNWYSFSARDNYCGLTWL